MAIHLYDESPSGPEEQRLRLAPPTAVLKAGIPCLVYGEDALSIIYCVPTVLFDLHLVVPGDAIDDAAAAICASLPYHKSESDPDKRWYEHQLLNKDRPYAFHLNSTSKLLIHNNRELAWEQVSSTYILDIFTNV